MMRGYGITVPERLLALLLHFGGEELYDVYEAIPETEKAAIPAEGDAPAVDIFERACTCLTNHFIPRQNKEFQRYEFRRMTQESGETLEKFVQRLKAMAQTCNFHDIDEEVKSQIIAGCASKILRRQGLSEVAWTLTKLIDTGKALEKSDLHAKDIEKTAGTNSGAVAALGRQKKPPRKPDKSSTETKKNCPACNREHGKQGTCPAVGRTCRNCGEEGHFANTVRCPAVGKTCGNCGKEGHVAKAMRCPARGKQCSRCSKIGHFAVRCRSGNKRNQNKVNSLEDAPDSDADYSWSLLASSGEKRPTFDVRVCSEKKSQTFKFLADSGATCNVVSLEDLRKIDPKPDLQPHGPVLPYGGGDPLTVKGEYPVTLERVKDRKKVSCEAVLVIVDNDVPPVLSWETSRELKLIDLVMSSSNTQKITEQFKDVFQGVGKMKDVKVSLHVDPTVQPVAQPTRRIPFHVRRDVEAQLKEDEERGIIEKVTGPTPWISPIVVVPKSTPGRVRVCVDMRMANKAIERERHPYPTLSEIMYELNGAKVFSRVDLKQAYNQLEIDENSRYITTFATHLGLYRYKRLFFGVNSAAEVFQKTISQALRDLEGVTNYSDDIVCFGASAEEHARNLTRLLERLRALGLTVNQEKCKFAESSIEFLGHVFSAEGVKPSPSKIKAIQQMDAPKNAKEVRSLLGMTNYCGQRFVKDYATITHDLRELTSKSTEWSWTKKHQTAFLTLKKELSKAATLAYFDPSAEISVLTDASPVGISAILTQTKNGKRENVHFASRALTPTEQRYSQIEREALAIVWACETLRVYLFGTDFIIITDHKPLLSLFNSPMSKPSARIEKWMLRLQPFRFELIFSHGENNPADYLSRHVQQDQKRTKEEKLAEDAIAYIAATSAPKPMPIDLIRSRTLEDPTLQAVIKAMKDGKWWLYGKDKHIDLAAYKCYMNISEELTTTQDDDLVIRGSRIVIPSSLQSRTVNLAHKGHQGIVRTKALIREKVWFYGIDKAVEECVKSCLPCQAATRSSEKEPLKMSLLPDAPWLELCLDFGSTVKWCLHHGVGR